MLTGFEPSSLMSLMCIATNPPRSVKYLIEKTAAVFLSSGCAPFGLQETTLLFRVRQTSLCIRYTMVKEVLSEPEIVQMPAGTDVQRHLTRSHVCSSASSAVQNACVFLRENMGTRRNAHATTTGKHKKASPNVLDFEGMPMLQQLEIEIFVQTNQVESDS